MSEDLNKLREDFASCFAKAKQIVAAARAEAPEGCDPQNTWIYVAGTVVSGVISYVGTTQSQKKSEKFAEQQRRQMFGDMAALNAATGEEAFGSIPEHAPYEPIDLTQSQLDTIQGNLRALPSAALLSDRTNDEILKQDLKRIRALVPQYDTNINRMGDVTRDLLLGRLPYGDVLDITANRSELAGMIGTPGGSANATLRDLGLSQLQATQQGGSMFQQMLQAAEAVNPQQSRMRPQSMFFSPMDRAQLDITQAQLEQQSEQSGNNLAAMADPRAAAMYQSQLQMILGGAGRGTDPGPGTQAAYNAIAQTIGAGINIYGAQQNKSQTGGSYANFGTYGATGQPASMTGGGMPISQQYYAGNQAYSWNGQTLRPASAANYYSTPTGSYLA